MQFRIYLDGNLYDEPLEASDIHIILEEAKTIKGLFKKYTNKLVFIGDAYAYLWSVKQNYDPLKEVLVNIQYRESEFSGWKALLEGVFFICDVKFTLYPYLRAEVVVEDNSWTSYVNNNKATKAKVTVARSKNDVDLTGGGIVATAVSSKMFYSDGTQPVNRNIYSVYECFRFLIAFMTDDKVVFDSNSFRSGGELEGVFICTGLNLSGGGLENTSDAPTISFQELFSEMDKKFNISAYLDTTGTYPKVWIEQSKNLETDLINLTLENPNKVELTFDKSILFSKVKFGQTNSTPFDGVDSDFPDNKFLGWQAEEYNVLGQANIDTALDLESSWYADHNTIHQVVKNSVQDFNSDIFIIQCTDSAGGEATRFDTYNPGTAPYYYNLSMTNQEVANNYLGYIPNSIITYLDLLSNSSQAFLTADKDAASVSADLPVIVYDDDSVDGYDPANNYNSTTGRYTAPADGSYNFSCKVRIDWENWLLLFLQPDGTTLGTFYYRRYDVTNVLIEQQEIAVLKKNSFGLLSFNESDIPATPNACFSASKSFFLTATDYVTLEYDEVIAGVTLRRNYLDSSQPLSYNQCQAVKDEGGIYQEYDPNRYQVVNYDLEYPLNSSDMFQILTYPFKKIRFLLNGQFFAGKINTVNLQLRESKAILKLKDKNK